jgi:hypothetical protein
MRVVLLGNSQSTATGVQPGESYPSLLRRELLPAHEFHPLAMTGWSVRDFNTHLENVTMVEPDLVVMQVGIVECSRRILSEREKRALARLPRSNLLTKALHDRRQSVIRFRNRIGADTRLFTPAEFDREVAALTKTLGAAGADVVLLEIPPFGPRYEEIHFPLINDDIRIFNEVLRRHGAVPTIGAHDDLESLWQVGTVHFNRAGHELRASRVLERIGKRLLRGASAPAGAPVS